LGYLGLFLRFVFCSKGAYYKVVVVAGLGSRL
jgi:hypothetical protein